MIYLRYDAEGNVDGVGAQVQRLMCVYILTKLLGIGYIHSQIVTKEHDFTEEMTARFQQLVELESTLPAPLEDAVHGEFILFFGEQHCEQIEKMKKEYMGTSESERKDIIIKMSHSLDYFDKYPNRLVGVLPHFSWIQRQSERPKNAPIEIAIHIRRGDVSQFRNQNRYLPFEFYLQCILYLHNILKDYPSTNMTIYSEGNLRQELDKYSSILNTMPNLKYKIDEDPIDTFKELVNSDILIAGYSSFSYSAAILKQKGLVFYPGFFRHSYPSHHIGIRQPNEIKKYESMIKKYAQQI